MRGAEGAVPPRPQVVDKDGIRVLRGQGQPATQGAVAPPTGTQ